jgi:alpha-D-xyloside xylohydrolase
VVRHFTQLKCRMMPYLYRQAALANECGTPMLRAMMLEFPDDPACDYLDRQYMLGDSVLVAPVFSEAGEVQFYLPEGRWTHLWHNDELPGSRWHKQHHDALSLPVYVRDNTCWRWATMTRSRITPGMRAPPSSCSTLRMDARHAVTFRRQTARRSSP